jgi:uncharacterized protein (DUF2236 family)
MWVDIMMCGRYHRDVRTTLTLDEDVYRKLQLETRRSGRSFKEVLNEHLRRSFASAPPSKRREPFRVNARDMGLHPGIELANIEALLDQLDGPSRQ